MTVYISYENNILSLTGINSLKKRTKFSLKHILGGEIKGDNIVIENFNDIQSLIKFLDDTNVEYILDSNIQQEYEDELDEIEKFQIFSKEAKKIWSASYDSEYLFHFTKILSNKMKRRLYKLQLLSAFHLAFSQNACNFSVPGAGKTSIVYGAYTYLKNTENLQKRVDKLLIVGPLSSFKAWEDEYVSCFGTKPTSTRIPNLTAKDKTKYFYSEDVSELTLISYQSLINQVDNIIYFLRNNNVMVILDEAHKIKNTNEGKFSSSALSIAQYSKSRVILTGTPAPNGYKDLNNLFEFIWPGKNIIKYSLIQLEDMTQNKNDKRVESLIENLLPYFIRIKKSDLSLPPITDNPPIYIEMDNTQKNIYNLISQKIIRDIQKDEEDSSIIGNFKKAKLIRLQQAASNPHLLLKPLDEMEYDIYDEFDDEILFHINSIKNDYIPTKFKSALDIIKSKVENNEKVIVWTIFVDTLIRFNDYLLENNINSSVVYGDTPSYSEDCTDQTREKIIENFKTGNISVLISNPSVLGESVSLHKTCHNAIYLERDFDAAKFVQSKDRIHRYGLKKDIDTNYYYPIMIDTIEETIAMRLYEKEKVMNHISESREIPLFNTNDLVLNKKDIVEVIKKYENINEDTTS